MKPHTSQPNTLRILSAVNVVLLAFHLYCWWVLAALWAAGINGWAGLLFLVGPPTGVVALVASMRRPVRRMPAIVNVAVVLLYAAIWVPLIPHILRSRGQSP